VQSSSVGSLGDTPLPSIPKKKKASDFAIFKKLANSTFVVGSDGKIILANRTARQFAGHSKKQMVGQNLNNYFQSLQVGDLSSKISKTTFTTNKGPVDVSTVISASKSKDFYVVTFFQN
jgi:PAS domain S-box-containing protein